MIKKYDYWLIIWESTDGKEVHEPCCFDVGTKPDEWCKIMLDRTNNTRDARSPRYKSYKIFKLRLEDL